VKKEQPLPPGADHGQKIFVFSGRKMYAAGLLGQQFFKENPKWRTKIHTSLIVSGYEGHSDSLRVAA